MATYKSMSALKSAIRQKAQQAAREIQSQSLIAANTNLQWYYAGGWPEYYQRTGAMGNSARSEMSGGGNSFQLELYLDTDYSYPTGTWSTEKIFSVAEAGGLIGNGGFWQNTVDQMEDIIDTAMKNAGFAKK